MFLKRGVFKINKEFYKIRNFGNKQFVCSSLTARVFYILSSSGNWVVLEPNKNSNYTFVCFKLKILHGIKHGSS